MMSGAFRLLTTISASLRNFAASSPGSRFSTLKAATASWLRPADSVGFNGNGDAGPFMFETVGDFNVGRNPFTDPQPKTVITVIALVQMKFGLPSSALNFHRELASTDCPGSSLRKSDIIAAVEQLKANPNADAAGPDPLSPEGLRADLSADETARDGAFDLAQTLRELEAAERVGAGVSADEAWN